MEPRFDVPDHQPVLTEPKKGDVGPWHEVKVTCSCGQWKGSRGLHKEPAEATNQAYTFHAVHVRKLEQSPKQNRADSRFMWVLGGAAAVVAVGAVIAVGLAVTGPEAPQDEPEVVVYDDLECGALVDYAGRDDITTMEKARALDEYNQNC